jgi:hypothetical protein
MSPRRLVAVAVLSPALIALAACSSTTSGNGAPTGGALPGNTIASTPKSAPTSATGLSAQLQHGLASITSAHIAIDVSAGGLGVQGAGDEQVSNGKLTAFDLAETISSMGTLRLRIVDGKTYAGLPPALNKSGKPWVLVTANSSNPVVKSLSTSINSAQSAASLDAAGQFVAAAKSVKLVGSESLGGTPVNHYAIVVDVSKLSAAYPGREALNSAGLTTVPVDLWIDSAGRPAKVLTKFTVQGQTVSSQATLSRFNEPVHITAPPADQVSTS